MAEWYRNTDWNDEIEADFFARLARARSQRDQYLVIQAVLLAESRPETTLRLVDLYFRTRTEDFHNPRARSAASAAHFALGGYAEALDNYLAILDDGEAQRDLHVGSPLQFAFLAARYRSAPHYVRALELLSDLPRPGETQADARFRHAAARAIVNAETGRDPAGARGDARLALALPEDLLNTYPDVTWRLRGIARR
jgi:hypothetical protein